jgi:YegS/Rv2252/BmrU family lipid kinase
VYYTKSVGDAEHFIKGVCANSEDICRFYACGGDGTLNECVNGVIGNDQHEVAVIPIGTGNDFTRNFLSKENFLNIEAQIDSIAAKCDVIKYNDRYCINVANVGLDCEVVARTDKIKKNPMVPSKLAYIFGLIGEFIKKSGIVFSCKIDGVEREKKKYLLALFANGGFYGGGFHSAPLAELSDGLIDVCFINYISRLTFLGLVSKYKKGTFLSAKNIDNILEYIKCSKIEIEFEKKERICIDGELEECDKLTIEVVKEKINFAVPKNVVEKMKYLRKPTHDCIACCFRHTRKCALA